MKRLIFIIFALFLNYSVGAQTDTLAIDKRIDEAIILPDSTEAQKKPFDTTRGVRFKRITSNLYGDFKKVVGVSAYTPVEKPKIVFWRSMLVPSSGQIMNRDYWKVPIVYLSAAGGVGTIWFNNSNYKRYIGIVEQMHIHGEEVRPHPDNPNGYPISINQYARAASQYKRWRDFSWIGFGFGWTLFAVEANVSAHLKNFDISDDISFKIEPDLIYGYGYVAPGIKLSLNFK